MAANEDVPIRIEERAQRKRLDAIELQPVYLDQKNEIVAPEKVAVISQYFLDKWAPLLGPTLTLLIIRLRRYCYFNKLTDEFTFRFNRRTSRSRGKLFYRLLQNAMAVEPVAYKDIIKGVRGSGGRNHNPLG